MVTGLILTVVPGLALVRGQFDYLDQDCAYLEKFYQDLHPNPELSGQEKETSRKVAQELTKAGFEVTENVGGYGVVGVFGNADGPIL
ncbi:hypothetical protein CEE34_10620 [Candidatus Aerophobetes bacterium Ae_b3a]|nr:MAG: hypothetical protein CEE34_10620 [Candidatus Aerophobetes bacterium Ae_b3a]